MGLCWRAPPQGIARPGRENDPPGPGPPVGSGLFVFLKIIFLSCYALKTHLLRHQTTLAYARYCLAEPEPRSLKSSPVSDLVDYPSFRRCLTPVRELLCVVSCVPSIGPRCSFDLSNSWFRPFSELYAAPNRIGIKPYSWLSTQNIVMELRTYPKTPPPRPLSPQAGRGEDVLG